MTYFKITATTSFDGTTLVPDNAIVLQDTGENEFSIKTAANGDFTTVGAVKLGKLVTVAKLNSPAYVPVAVFVGTATSFTCKVIDTESTPATLSQPLSVTLAGGIKHVSGLTLIETTHALSFQSVGQVGSAQVRFELLPVAAEMIGELEANGFTLQVLGGLPVYIGPSGTAVVIQTNAAALTVSALGGALLLEGDSATLRANVGNVTVGSTNGTARVAADGNVQVQSDNGDVQVQSVSAQLNLDAQTDVNITSVAGGLVASFADNMSLNTSSGTGDFGCTGTLSLQSVTADAQLLANSGIDVQTTTGNITLSPVASAGAVVINATTHTQADEVLVINADGVRPSLRVGTEDPTAGPIAGADGDLYWRVAAGSSNLYVRRAGVWVPAI